MLGICDRHQRLCFALALWNGRDPILKERLFGLTGNEGNHGEDVKEYYFYLDSTPTHSYMKALYKYPQAAFPYDDLVEENRRRSRARSRVRAARYRRLRRQPLLRRLRRIRQGRARRHPDPHQGLQSRPRARAARTCCPRIWFRNTWSLEAGIAASPRPATARRDRASDSMTQHATLRPPLALSPTAPPAASSSPTTRPTAARSSGVPNRSPYVKDGIGECLVRGDREAVNPERRGTKAAAHYHAGPSARRDPLSIRLRLTDAASTPSPFGPAFDASSRSAATRPTNSTPRVTPPRAADDGRAVSARPSPACSGRKQFYHYDVRDWLDGDPA